MKLWLPVIGFVVPMLAGGVWALLFGINLRTTPSIPWAVVPMAALLWLTWQYLGGKGAPRSTSSLRRRSLRANAVGGAVFAWSIAAGALAIVALAGLWIVLFQLVPMRANTLPDVSQYPALTMAFLMIMGSMVSPITEEAGFRGYIQVTLETRMRASIAIAISSLLFAFPHGITHGFLWPKLLVYFLGGVMLGTIAFLAQSIVPGLLVHAMADMTFFTMVWPYDAARRLVANGGADAWFWIHAAQALLCGALAILAYRKLARIAKGAPLQNTRPASGLLPQE